MDKEVSEVDRKLFLRKTYLDKIYYHINRNPINQEELYLLIRKFFGEYLKLDYEFTYEELSQELNKIFVTPKVKEHIDDFLIRLSESEYLEETILGTSDINKYLEELGDIIKNIIYDDQPVHQTESIVQKVLKRHREAPKVIDVSSISALIEETNFHITNGNMDIAKSSYVNLLKAYDALNKDDKKKLHDDLNEVYERLQTLIKNPNSVVGLDKKTATTYTISDSVKKVRDLADDTLFYINASNSESAKNKYSDTLKLYESLEPEEKKILHSRINDLYTQLQAMLSVTTYVEGEPGTKSEDAKKGTDEQTGVENLGTGNVALNMDLSTLSPTSTFTSSDTSKTDSASFNNTSLFGVDDSNANVDLSNVDISVASNNLASTTEAEDNRLSRPSPNTIDFAAPVETDLENQADTSKKKSVQIGMDFILQPDNTTKASNEVGNVLFNANSINAESKENKKEKILAPKNAITMASSTAVTSKAAAPKTSVVPRTPLIASHEPPVQIKLSSTEKSPSTIRPSSPIKSSSPTKPTNDAKPIFIQPVIQQSIHPSMQPSVDKLNQILKKIDDDIILDKFDRAKDTYKEALLFYRSMPDENKVKCYEHFYATFKRLDDALHQKSLHDILDKHLSDAEESHRPISLAPDEKRGENYTGLESSKITKMTTLPVMLANDPEMTRVYELIEESYFNIDNEHSDLAMLKYFKALELYHKLPMTDKKKLYTSLYDLFKKLSIVKKV